MIPDVNIFEAKYESYWLMIVTKQARDQHQKPALYSNIMLETHSKLNICIYNLKLNFIIWILLTQWNNTVNVWHGKIKFTVPIQF